MSDNTGTNTGNLKPPWGKGQSGNPAGRPKKLYSLTSLLREYGEDIDGEDKATKAQRLAKAMWKAALEGDRQFAMYIIDRLDGKPKERIEHSESQVLRVMLDDGTEEDTSQSEAEKVHTQSS